MSDDAAITLRTVMNFTYGYGPVFNVGERVQAFTHPLWFIVLALGHSIFHDIIKVAFAVSIGVSLLFMLLVTQLACRRFLHSFIIAAIFMSCKSYVDFSSSGLENPLSNILLTLFILASIQALEAQSTFSMVAAGFIGSLVYLTRADLILLIFPLSMYVAVRLRPRKSQALLACCAALIPALVWTLFSIIYYGAPFPNTAYAKIGPGTPLLFSILQGWTYVKESFSVDPITLTTITIGILVGLMSGGVERWLSLGATLYLLYVLRVGGDFMSGRFFVAPLIVSVIILARKPRYFTVIGLGLVVCGAFNFNAAILEQRGTTVWDEHGIADERRFYWPLRNLKQMVLFGDFPNYNGMWDAYTQRPPLEVKRICGGLGYLGLEKGPDVHIVDTCGLSDPLLARLPSRPYQRVGHWERNVPANYEMSVKDDRNLLADEDVRGLYDDIRLVTRGPLFTRERWRAIYDLNLGKKRDLSRWSAYSP